MAVRVRLARLTRVRSSSTHLARPQQRPCANMAQGGDLKAARVLKSVSSGELWSEILRQTYPHPAASIATPCSHHRHPGDSFSSAHAPQNDRFTSLRLVFRRARLRGDHSSLTADPRARPSLRMGSTVTGLWSPRKRRPETSSRR